VHAETGQAPIERFQAAGPPRQASPDLIREAFRWSVARRVTRTATVPLEGNAYAVDPALVGRRVELRYDPLRGIPRKGSYGQPRVMRRATERAAFVQLGRGWVMTSST